MRNKMEQTQRTINLTVKAKKKNNKKIHEQTNTKKTSRGCENDPPYNFIS